jgi:ABC-2 type transport system ATP-binding protein
MDEAVQCDNIAYIAYGKKLIDGPAADIPTIVGLHTWRVEGTGLAVLSQKLTMENAVEQVARFGAALHISGTDAPGLRAVVDKYRDAGEAEWTEQPAGLEEVFIHLMDKSQDNFANGT